MSQQPYGYNYSAPTPPEPQNNKNTVYIVIIAMLVVACLALSFLVLLKAGTDDSAKNEDNNTVIPPTTTYNIDSALLSELRDSLRNASPASAAGQMVGFVAADKMNVFYIGVDNPITITAPGVNAGDLTPSIVGGSMRSSGKPGSYIVTVSGGTEATINVAAQINGTTRNLGSYKYRIKRVPDPVAYVGSIKGDGQMTKTELQAVTGVFARMENFDFDLSYQVVSFVMTMNVNGVYVEKKATGPAITAEMKQLMGGTKPGDVVMFSQITVKGPDGTLRKVAGVVIKVK